MLPYIIGFSFSVAASSFLSWVIRTLASRLNLMRPPHTHHIHEVPTPRLGGLAIYGTFLMMFLVYVIASGHGWVKAPTSLKLAKILAIGTFVLILGVVDDLVGVHPRIKLLVEGAAGLGLYAFGIRFNFFCGMHFAGSWTWVLCLAMTVAWVILICNAINLIDGVDGLAAGATMFSMVTIFIVAQGTQPGIAAATTIMAGSLLGFLIFNFNPASIFLGDSGSLFLGFMLSAFVLSEQSNAPSQNTFVNLLVPVVCFALPLTDVALSVLRRFLSGHSIFRADKEHIHHKLLNLGLSQRQVVCVLYGVSALFSSLSLFLLNRSRMSLLLVFTVLSLTIFFGMTKLRYHDFEEFLSIPQIGLQSRKVLARNIGIRKAATELQRSCDLVDIATLLKANLKQGFDGFAVMLDADAIGRIHLPHPWAGGLLEVNWKSGTEALALGLISNDGLLFGELFLYHDGSSSIVVRPDLLTELQCSISKALLNAVASDQDGVPLHSSLMNRQIQLSTEYSQ